MAKHNKEMADAKDNEAKDIVKTQKQNTTTGLRTCNDILAMTKPLYSKTTSFIGDKRVNLSMKEAAKPSVSLDTTTRGKRHAIAANRSGNMAKKGREAGGLQNQLVNRALEGLSHGGAGARQRSRGRVGLDVEEEEAISRFDVSLQSQKIERIWKPVSEDGRWDS